MHVVSFDNFLDSVYFTNNACRQPAYKYLLFGDLKRPWRNSTAGEDLLWLHPLWALTTTGTDRNLSVLQRATPSNKRLRKEQVC